VAVHAQFDRVIDVLAEKLPTVAEHLQGSRIPAPGPHSGA
jgi:hypothetical protein